MLDVYKFHHPDPRMLRYFQREFRYLDRPRFNEESLEDALIRKIREKGESVMFLMSGQNDNVINLRSFRRGLRLESCDFLQ